MPKVLNIESPGLELYSIKQEGEPIGSIGIPVRDHLNAATVTSMVTTAISGDWLPAGQTVDINIVQGAILTGQRNELIQRMRGDWLLFIDDDMVWHAKDIARLIETQRTHDLDMVGGLCFRRSYPYQPTIFMREQKDGGSFNFLESWPEDTAMEVDATGMAFILIHRRVFERMVAYFENKPGWQFPPYEERARQSPPNFFRWTGKYGEDLRFCMDAREAGNQIYVDTAVKIGHMAEIEINEEAFLIALAKRTDEEIAARRDLNVRMDLPTVTREEARRRLGW